MAWMPCLRLLRVVVAPVLLHREIACVAVTAGSGSPGCWLPGSSRSASSGHGRQHRSSRRFVGQAGITGVLLVHQPGAVQLWPVRPRNRFLRHRHAPMVPIRRTGGWLASLPLAPTGGPACASWHSRARLRNPPAPAWWRPPGWRCARSSCGTCSAALAGLCPPGSPRRRPGRRPAPFAKVQQRVGGAAPAQLVVQAGQRHVVPGTPVSRPWYRPAWARRTARCPSRPAPACRPAPDLGQHQVDDAFRVSSCSPAEIHILLPRRRSAGQADRPRLPAPRGWRCRSRTSRPVARSGTWCRPSGR